MRIRISAFLLGVAAFSQMGATDCGNVLRDSGFDLWCGDQMCAWKVERGSVQRVATWNEGDPGVELVGDDVAIEQLSPVNYGDGTCIEFTLIANIDPNAEVDLDVDVLGDGSVEHTERLPAASWKPLVYDIAIKAPYDGVRFEIAKTGAGRAMLANIGAKIVDGGCAGITPIDPGPLPNGVFCENASDCASGLCTLVVDPDALFGFTEQCVGCDPKAPACGTGETCGFGTAQSPVREVPVECVPTAGKQLAEQCITGDECETGICTNNVCSTCGACPGSEVCGVAWPKGPSVCSPGDHIRKQGEPCASDDDCASSSCGGAARLQCEDGRACVTAAQCPFGGEGTETGLQNGPCTTVGIQGGVCQ